MKTLAVAVCCALTGGCAYYTLTPEAASLAQVQVQAQERLAAQDATTAERVLLTCDQFLIRGTPAHALCVMRGIDQYTGETRYRVPAYTQVVPAPGIYKAVGPYCYHDRAPYPCSGLPR